MDCDCSFSFLGVLKCLRFSVHIFQRIGPETYFTTCFYIYLQLYSDVQQLLLLTVMATDLCRVMVWSFCIIYRQIDIQSIYRKSIYIYVCMIGNERKRLDAEITTCFVLKIWVRPASQQMFVSYLSSFITLLAAARPAYIYVCMYI